MGTTLKQRLEILAKQSKNVYNDLYRKAKVMKSSAFEGILLKATWPGNDPVPPELLTEIVKYSVPSFKYARTVSYLILKSSHTHSLTHTHTHTLCVSLFIYI
jgi:hypothetical protein